MIYSIYVSTLQWYHDNYNNTHGYWVICLKPSKEPKSINCDSTKYQISFGVLKHKYYRDFYIGNMSI